MEHKSEVQMELAEILDMDRRANVDAEDTGLMDQLGGHVRDDFTTMAGSVTRAHIEGAYIGAMCLLHRTLGLAEADEIDQGAANEFACLITEFRIVLARMYSSEGALEELSALWNI